MLSAYNQHQDDVVAWEVTREQGPFSCPECGAEVVVRKGMIKIHHFAHLPESNCTYGTGESEELRRAKYDIYEALRQHTSVSSLKVDRKFKGVRPDVSFRWQDRHDVAIELQISTIALNEVEQRTRRYTANNMSLLWMTPYHSGITSLIPYRTKLWERYLHALYFGKVYYWLGKDEVIPVHFEPYSLGRVSKVVYDEDRQELIRREFESYAWDLKNLELGDSVRITDLKTVWRPGRQIGKFIIPKAKLWSL